ncbi:MAG: hypothetical protein WC303_02310 [Candidatus Paceibacterota bacterium]
MITISLNQNTIGLMQGGKVTICGKDISIIFYKKIEREKKKTKRDLKKVPDETSLLIL